MLYSLLNDEELYDRAVAETPLEQQLLKALGNQLDKIDNEDQLHFENLCGDLEYELESANEELLRLEQLIGSIGDVIADKGLCLDPALVEIKKLVDEAQK